MWKKGFKFSRLAAGFMTAAMILGSGSVPVFADDSDDQAPVIVYDAEEEEERDEKAEAAKMLAEKEAEFDAQDLAPIRPVKINSSTFPDPNFRAYVSEAFDRNKNGTLDTDDIIYARNIWADNRNIKSLKGIEYLTELRGLYASHNHLTELDLSGNQLITGVWVAYNDFTSLDFSSTPTLEWVYCHYCPNLRSLNVKGNPEMSYIEVNSSPIGSIDLSKNSKLEHLMIGDCGLTQLDLSHNPNMQHLDAFRNNLTKLDVTCCPRMKRLDIWDNPKLGSIDVSKCPGLQYYNCANNNASSVDVTHNPELTKLIVSYNQNPKTGFKGLTSLDVSHNPKLVYLDIGRNSISNLDISKNTELYYLMVFTNPLKEIKIGNCRRLLKVYKDGVKKAEPNVCQGHSWTIDYGGQTSTGNDNIFCLVVDDATKINTNPIAGAPEPVRNTIRLTSTSNLMTRESVVQALYQMAGKPSVSGLTTRFHDVKPGESYYNAMLWGQKIAMCMGYPDVYDDNFGVGEFITREDLCFMLMRYSEYMNYERSIDFGRSDDFMDYYDVDYYAWEAVCWACTWNIMVGKGDPNAPKSERKLDPLGAATVDDYKFMVAKMLEVNKKEDLPMVVPKAVEAKLVNLTVYNGVDYKRIFDTKFYAEKYPDLKNAYGFNNFLYIKHFVEHGMAEGRQGSSNFDVTTYKNLYPDLRKNFGNDLKKYYIHYMNHGYKEGRRATGGSAIVSPLTVYNGVDYSKVYDFNYYINKYSDMKKYYANDDVGAIKHFVEHGMAEGRQGKAAFELGSYKNSSPDLRKHFGNDNKKYYIHYMNHGYAEGRKAVNVTKMVGPTTVYNGVDYSKVYDFNFYINKYADMKKYFQYDDAGAIKHFVEHGMAEGRQGSSAFDINSYKNAYPDLRKNFLNNNTKYYIHYINHGYKEKRVATGVTSMKNPVTVYNGVDYSRVYDFNYYINKYPDMKKYYQYDDAGALKHYVLYGIKEGRQASANFNLQVYRQNSPDLQKYYGFAAQNNIKYVTHYIYHGYKEGRKAK